MKRFSLLLLAVASASLAVHAEPVPLTTPVTDPSAAVPPPKYQSAYADYLPAAQAKSTSDQLWIQANRNVAGQSEHGGHEGASMQMAPANKAEPAAAPATPQHKGQHMNKKVQ